MMSFAPARAEDALRATVAAPLQAAQDLMKAGKHKEALAKVREAEAMRELTPYESHVIDRMRGAAAAASGDDATASASFDAALASGRLDGAEKLQTLEALSRAAYRSKNYPKAIDAAQRYSKEGGNNPQISGLLLNARFQSGDHAGVVREVQARLAAGDAVAAGVDEPALRLMGASQLKLGDDPGYTATLERLLALNPTKEYWADRLARLQSRPGFADRLALDLLRLQMATQTMDEPAQYLETAQLATKAGLPAEAKRAIEAGYAAGKLGTGADAAAHKRLRDQATQQSSDDEKSLARDGAGRTAETMVVTGQALVAHGKLDKGIESIEQGLAKGGLKRPDDARLHLGVALLQAGNKAKALTALQTVRGDDGVAELARLWMILARQK